MNSRDKQTPTKQPLEEPLNFRQCYNLLKSCDRGHHCVDRITCSKHQHHIGNVDNWTCDDWQQRGRCTS